MNHNRQSKTQTESGQQTAESYFYAPTSNRLQVVETSKTTGPALEDRPSRTMGYNHANRQAELYEAGELKAAYIYNANGQRTRKVTPDAENGSTTIYHYDLNGLLIGETTAAGEPIRDYLWQDGIPLAQIDSDAVSGSDTVHYLHTDHLMTPRLATNQNQTITWRWEGEAFGETNAREDPDGDGNTTTINLRFPGQYYDSETGLHYNWFRDYNPQTGRYRQSDLIGLAGGMNTYGYAGGNPVMYYDPDGLIWSVSERDPDIGKNDPNSGPIDLAKNMQNKYPGVDDMGDARRHAEWMREASIRYGRPIAFAMGEAHEMLGGESVGSGSNTLKQSEMDRHNNREGLSAAEEGRPVNPDNLMPCPGCPSKNQQNKAIRDSLPLGDMDGDGIPDIVDPYPYKPLNWGDDSGDCLK